MSPTKILTMRQLYRDLRRVMKILPYKPEIGLSEYEQSKKLEIAQNKYTFSVNFFSSKLDSWEKSLSELKQKLDSLEEMDDQKPIFDKMQKTARLIKMVSSFQMSSAYLISQLIGKIDRQTLKIESLEAEIKRLKMYSDFENTISNKFINHLSKGNERI